MSSSVHDDIAAWLAESRSESADLGADPGDVRREAVLMLQAISTASEIPASYAENPWRLIEVLHALVGLFLARPNGVDPMALDRAFTLLEKLVPEDLAAHRDYLMSELSLAGWRAGKYRNDPAAISRWRTRTGTLLRLASKGVSTSKLGVLTEQAKTILGHSPAEDHPDLAVDFSNPELVLAIVQQLTWGIETMPQHVGRQAATLFALLREQSRTADPDNLEYFLGELSLVVGMSHRIQHNVADSRRWLTSARGHFSRCVDDPVLDLRAYYQLLALDVEERLFDRVLAFAPECGARAEELGLADEHVKCRMIKALALQETGRLSEAVEELEQVDPAAIDDIRLRSTLLLNLVQQYVALGRFEDALALAPEALSSLSSSENQIGLAKLRWYVGDIYKASGDLERALEAYRNSRIHAEKLGVRGDVAAIHLVTADLLLDMGLDAQAEWEVRAALPIIDEEKMVPEGFAALSLLRESLRRRKLDRGALRTLHGYFKE